MKTSHANFENSVVILCGGEGTRMKEETEFKPKPMVLVGNKPIIWHIMKIYGHYGFNNFVLTLGYKGNMIKEYFLDSKAYNNNFTLNTSSGKINYHTRNGNDNFNITFVETGGDTNTGERVRRVSDFIKGDYFLLTYGDGVADVNLKDLVSFHKEKGKLITITGVRPPSKYGRITVDDNMTALEFKQKPILSDFVNGGFMVINREVLEILGENNMIEDDIINLVGQKQVAVFEHNGFWQAMDTYKEMKDLNEIWDTTRPWKVWA